MKYSLVIFTTPEVLPEHSQYASPNFTHFLLLQVFLRMNELQILSFASQLYTSRERWLSGFINPLLKIRTLFLTDCNIEAQTAQMSNMLRVRVGICQD